MDRTTRRRQLDAQVRPLAQLPRNRPARGWSTAVRQALGMSTRQLGHRLGVTQQAVARLERAEETGAITLKNLERLAKALDSNLVYAFVPRESFEHIVRQQAELIAQTITSRVESSMALEDQATPSEAQRQRESDLIDEYVRTTPRQLWDQT